MMKIRVLVIDDEIPVVKPMLKRLEHYLPDSVIFEPIFVDSVIRALNQLTARAGFDAVFLDIVGVDRNEKAISNIRLKHYYVPIIMFSKQASAGMIMKYWDLGASTFIDKADLPPEVLSDRSPIRSEQENKVREVVNRFLPVVKAYQPVKTLLARPLENGTVRKSGSSPELKDQIRFLQEVANVPEVAGFFPPVRDPQVMEYAACYEMPFYEMKDLYKYLLSEPSQDSCEDVAKRVLAEVVKGPFLQLSKRGRKTELTDDIVQILFFDRFERRLKEARQTLGAAGDAAEPEVRLFAQLLDCDLITVGDKALKSPAAILEEIRKTPALYARLKPPFLSWIHGDLHFKNILLDARLPQMIKIMLVDPKGTRVKEFSVGTGDPAYDLGKLLYSSGGRYYLIQDQLFCPPGGSLRISKDKKEATVEAFAKVDKGRAPVLGGLSKDRLSVYRATVPYWIWDVFDNLGRHLKECVEQTTDYHTEDPDWLLRACLYEGLHFCCLAPMCAEENPEEACNLFLRGTELLNKFWKTYNDGGFPVPA